MPGFLTNDLPPIAQVTAKMKLPVDTLYNRGGVPASVGAGALQIAGTLAECTGNTATSTSAAATLNTFGGVVTTEALTTAVGAQYSFNLTNSQITQAYINSGAQPLVGLYSVSNTGGNLPPDSMAAEMAQVSVTLTVGHMVVVFQNNGASALNGTMALVFHL